MISRYDRLLKVRYNDIITNKTTTLLVYFYLSNIRNRYDFYIHFTWNSAQNAYVFNFTKVIYTIKAFNKNG